jgi:hypothetical protein
MGKSELSEPLLFAGGEREVGAAVDAGDLLVRVRHRFFLLVVEVVKGWRSRERTQLGANRRPSREGSMNDYRFWARLPVE